MSTQDKSPKDKALEPVEPAPARRRLELSPSRVVAAVALLVLVGTMAWIGNRLFTQERLGPAGTEALGDEPIGVEVRTLTLYFGVPDSVELGAERRDIPSGAGLGRDLASLFDDLASGPATDLVPLIPKGTRVRHVFLDASGTVYVDFTRELVTGFQGGLSRELLLVRSIARTLTVNYTGISRLQILVNGRAVPSLGGHIDLSRPLTLSDWG
jgi:germination protein M